MLVLRFTIAAMAALVLAGCDDSRRFRDEPSGPVSPTPDVARLIVAGTPPAVGASSQFTAVAVLADGSSRTVTPQAYWASSDPIVATVTAGGVVTGVSPGPVVVSATYGGTRGFQSFTVAQPATYTLYGRVTDASGASVAAATVTVRSAAGGMKLASADGSGNYSVSGVPQGAAEVTFVAPGYAAATRTLIVYGNARLDVALTKASPCPSIGFDDTGPDASAFTTYSRCGVTVAATAATWEVSTRFGNPAPFVEFRAPAGQAAVGELTVTASSGTFTFESVDLYSSVTPIPYVITGIARTSTAFTLQGTVPNTLGRFATVPNPNRAVRIDALVIRLTNAVPGGGGSNSSNPMGLDNLVLRY